MQPRMERRLLMKSHDERKAILEIRADKVMSSVQAAFMQALRLHRCVACAVRDIEEKVDIIGEAEAPRVGDCLEFCEDLSLGLQAVGPRDVLGGGGGLSGAGPARSISVDWDLVLDISLCLGEAWAAAMEMFECRNCAVAVIRAQVRKLGAQARAHIPAGCGREGYRRVCRRCQPDVCGIV